MKKSLKVVFLAPSIVLILICTAIAQTTDRQTETSSNQSVDSIFIPPAKIIPSPPRSERLLHIQSNSEPEAIECCTTLDTANGTTGCASFEGDTCPDYASFEAIPDTSEN